MKEAFRVSEQVTLYRQFYRQIERMMGEMRDESNGAIATEVKETCMSKTLGVKKSERDSVLQYTTYVMYGGMSGVRPVDTKGTY